MTDTAESPDTQSDKMTADAQQSDRQSAQHSIEHTVQPGLPDTTVAPTECDHSKIHLPCPCGPSFVLEVCNECNTVVKKPIHAILNVKKS